MCLHDEIKEEKYAEYCSLVVISQTPICTPGVLGGALVHTQSRGLHQ